MHICICNVNAIYKVKMFAQYPTQDIINNFDEATKCSIIAIISFLVNDNRGCVIMELLLRSLTVSFTLPVTSFLKTILDDIFSQL